MLFKLTQNIKKKNLNFVYQSGILLLILVRIVQVLFQIVNLVLMLLFALHVILVIHCKQMFVLTQEIGIIYLKNLKFYKINKFCYNSEVYEYWGNI